VKVVGSARPTVDLRDARYQVNPKASPFRAGYLSFGGLGEQTATTRSDLRPKSTSPTIKSRWRQYPPQAAWQDMFEG
jgi:hypothetical protein